MLARLRRLRASRDRGRGAAAFRLLPGGAPATQLGLGALAGSYGQAATYGRNSTKYVYGGATYSALSANQPGLEPRGFLSEPLVTSLVLHSRDLSQAAWTKTSATATKTATGVDGTANSASVLTATAANGTCLQALTVAAATRTTSFFVKRRTGTGNIDLTRNNGTNWATLSSSNCADLNGVATAPNSTGWVRVQLASSVLNPTVGLRLVTSGDAVDVDFGQDEGNGVATSPISTAGTTVSRLADSLRFAVPAGLSGSSWAVGMSIDLRAWSARTDTGVLFQADSVYAAANHVALYLNTTGTLTLDVFDAAAAVKAVATNAAIAASGPVRLVAMCRAGALSLWVNGSQPAQTGSGAGTGLVTTWAANFYAGMNRTAGQVLDGWLHSYAVGSSYSAVAP